MYPDHGVGLRTGTLVGLDIDILDEDRAHQVHRLAEARFGGTLVRVGLWPKRLLLYRAEVPFRKLKSGRIEVMGVGQQVLAFGRHEITGRDYYWPDGETPLDVPLEDLPGIDAEAAAAFLAEAVPGSEGTGSRSNAGRTAGSTDKPVRDADGVVIDGRDAWLSQIAFHEVHDMLDAGADPDAGRITARVWQRFLASTDLTRGIGGGERCYDFRDARTKVRDKLRLAGEGRLPPRTTDIPEPDYDLPALSADEGRERLDRLLHRFCADVRARHRNKALTNLTLGVQATVGLGKTVLSRDHLLRLMGSLRDEALPHRIIVFTPSHVLAEETAAAWKQAGADAVVARGYERSDPATAAPMCKDLEAVRAALAARLSIHGTVCAGKGGVRCRHFHDCPKQANLRDVAAADVVVAPYDALFSGLAFDKDDIALLVIDEGCWARALDVQSDLYIDDFESEPLSGMGRGTVWRGPMGAMADLRAFRLRLATALRHNGPGALGRAALTEAGLEADECHAAARLERWRLQDTGLRPGLSPGERQRIFARCRDNARIEAIAGVWDVLKRFLATGQVVAGNIVVREADARGRQRLELRQIRKIHESLKGKPILHLDATLRPELARTVLPSLQVDNIDVAAPHMHVRHVSGSFGKSMLCPQTGLQEPESARRANRLQECVDYVRWHARRVSARSSSTKSARPRTLSEPSIRCPSSGHACRRKQRHRFPRQGHDLAHHVARQPLLEVKVLPDHQRLQAQFGRMWMRGLVGIAFGHACQDVRPVEVPPRPRKPCLHGGEIVGPSDDPSRTRARVDMRAELAA